MRIKGAVLRLKGGGLRLKWADFRLKPSKVAVYHHVGYLGLGIRVIYQPLLATVKGAKLAQNSTAIVH